MERNNFLEKIKKLDGLVLASLGILLALSLLELYSIGPSLRDGFLFFKKQIIFIFLGFFLMMLMTIFDYQVFKEKPILIIFCYFLVIILLVVLLFFGIPTKGAKSWFKLGVLGFGPVELMKLILILLLAKFFSSRHIEMFRIHHLLASFFYGAVPVILVFLQPDFGSALILGGIWFGMVLVSGIKSRHFIFILVLFFIFSFLGWHYFFQGYQKARIIAYLNPLKDPRGHGYNVIQSIVSISSGGFWGKGLGQGSETQLGFLPERHTDFIFAAIGEEMGLFALILILASYGILIWRLFKIALTAKDNFGALIATGIGIMIVLQVFINISVSLGMIPVTGVSLPFLSYGGSNLLVFMMSMGIVLGIKSRN